MIEGTQRRTAETVDSGSFVLRATGHVSLLVALSHLERLGGDTTALRDSLRSEINEAQTQTAYPLFASSLGCDEDAATKAQDRLLPFTLHAVVEHFLSSTLANKLRVTAHLDSHKNASELSCFAPFNESSLKPVSRSLIVASTSKPAANILSTAFLSPNLLLASTSTKHLLVTDISTGNLLSRISVPSPILAITVHPTVPNLIATTAMDGTCTLLDPTQPDTPPHHVFKDHTKYVTRALFSPAAGTTLATAGLDAALLLYTASANPVDGPTTGALTYTLTHRLSLPGPIEALAFLPGSETLVAAARGDAHLHFITPGAAQHARASMNANGDAWVSFTGMDMALMGLGPARWALAVYTDMPSGRICFYVVQEKPGEGSGFRVEFVGDCYGVVADGFSRPRCAFLERDSGKEESGGKVLLLAATSDDGKVVLFDVGMLYNTAARLEGISGAGDGHGVGFARKVGELVGHGGLVRSLTVREEVVGSVLYSGSFDSTVREWKF
ncbi:WD40-repeat-containing domain protein [Chytriomyces sp. MP71]|nr:WD40-repeat-containing domain protein [Chytriomyces sp. MP71]